MYKQFFMPILIIFISILLLYINHPTKMAITYFPIDDNSSFIEATTNLYFSEKSQSLLWTTYSISDSKVYLRQDVSLLFENGKLKAVNNQWKQDIDMLSQENEILVKKNNRYYQAISFHHGEIHHNDDDIFSIQEISADEIYIINNQSDKGLHNKNSQKLNQFVTKQLDNNWNNLIRYFDLHPTDYEFFSLIDFKELKDWLNEMDPTLNDKKITGQLWEGLYKNYIIRASDENSNTYAPLILVAKDLTHLLVLYEMNGEKLKLIQGIN